MINLWKTNRWSCHGLVSCALLIFLISTCWVVCHLYACSFLMLSWCVISRIQIVVRLLVSACLRHEYGLLGPIANSHKVATWLELWCHTSELVCKLFLFFHEGDTWFGSLWLIGSVLRCVDLIGRQMGSHSFAITLLNRLDRVWCQEFFLVAHAITVGLRCHR